MADHEPQQAARPAARPVPPAARSTSRDHHDVTPPVRQPGTPSPTATTEPGTISQISVAVYGATDTTRCGQTTEGAYVAVPLSDELVAAATAYQAPDYQPLDTTERHTSWSSARGQYRPTALTASSGPGRTPSEETWKDPETDQNLADNALVPWLPTTG